MKRYPEPKKKQKKDLSTGHTMHCSVGLYIKARSRCQVWLPFHLMIPLIFEYLSSIRTWSGNDTTYLILLLALAQLRNLPLSLSLFLRQLQTQTQVTLGVPERSFTEQFRGSLESSPAGLVHVRLAPMSLDLRLEQRPEARVRRVVTSDRNATTPGVDIGCSG